MARLRTRNPFSANGPFSRKAIERRARLIQDLGDVERDVLVKLSRSGPQLVRSPITSKPVLEVERLKFVKRTQQGRVLRLTDKGRRAVRAIRESR